MRRRLMAQCRYYRGEQESPRNVDSLMWYYESLWVKWSFGTSEERGLLRRMEESYRAQGLAASEAADGTPLALMALLFDRYMHWIGSYGEGDPADGFRSFYASYKKGGRSL